MNSVFKMILYMFIIATDIDFTLPWPFLSPKDNYNVKQLQANVVRQTRISRQVVQPTGLNFGGESAVVDPKVHVDSQALRETEAIRKVIQKAVKEDTFVVTDEQQGLNSATDATFETTSPSSEIKTTHAMRSLPNWYIRLRNWIKHFFKVFHI